MQPGDVLFYSKNTSLITKAIAWVEKSPYTHVALYIGDNQLIEANYGIRTRKRDIEPSEEFEVHSFKDITDEQRAKIVDYALTMVGYRYSLRKILKYFFRLEFHIRLSIIEAKNKVVCSDIIDIPAFHAGIKRKLETVFEVGDVTPSELLFVYDLPKSN